MLSFFKTFKNKYCFVDLCCALVQAAREAIISSSLLDMAWNKHEWTSKGILFHFVSIPFFKLKSPNVNLFSCLVCYRTKWQICHYVWPDCQPIKLPVKDQLNSSWKNWNDLNRKTHTKNSHYEYVCCYTPFFIYTYNWFSLWYNFKQFLHYNVTYMQLKLTKVHSITFSCIWIHLFSLIPPSYSKLCNFRYVLNSKWVSSFGHSVCMNAANSSVA